MRDVAGGRLNEDVVDGCAADEAGNVKFGKTGGLGKFGERD